MYVNPKVALCPDGLRGGRPAKRGKRLLHLLHNLMAVSTIRYITVQRARKSGSGASNDSTSF